MTESDTGSGWLRAPPLVTCLGDSLTAGYGLRPNEALPNQLETAVERRGVSIRTENAGVSGDTSADALARLDRSVPAETALCVVALGANDMIQRRAVDRIIKDLETIARRLEARPCKVLLCGMRAPPWAGLYGRSFDAVYPIVAARVNAPLLPFLLEGVALDPALNLADGIHPNVHGVQRMAETLAPAVLDALGVRAG